MQMVIANLINGKSLQTVSEVLRSALGIVQQCCDKTNLNTNKVVIIPFTGKRDIREPTLSSETIQLSSKVKYLGLTSDKGLTWKKQLDK
jgi:hypothetical protein